MDDQITRAEYSRDVTEIHRRISEQRDSFEEKLRLGIADAKEHSTRNRRQSFGELQSQIHELRTIVHGDGGSVRGLRLEIAGVSQMVEQQIQPVLRECVAELKAARESRRPRSSESSGGHRAVRDAWASTPAGQKVLLALAAVLVAAASALGGYSAAPDVPPPQPTHVAPQ